MNCEPAVAVDVLLGCWLPALAWAQGISRATERITKPQPTNMKARLT